LASFIIGVGFWLINISHINYDINFIWGSITAIVSGLAILLLLVFSIQAISKKERLLSWTCLLTSVAMIISYVYAIKLKIWFY
jgi:Ni/Fe-hydrogenase subunit HybB-like protein